ncbi:MAG: hypothetical protein HUJ25_06415 [Crocinitomicaceae bacterium]|nr:hypothetical protein [Crocinitomicaceae bacterium]
MKAEDKDLKDEILKEAVNDGFKEEGLSSNFTHKVMENVNQLESVRKNKPLMPWWAWLITAGMFVSAIVLALIYAPMPSEPRIEITTDIQNVYGEYSSYIGIATLILAVILIDMVIRTRKKLSSY